MKKRMETNEIKKRRKKNERGSVTLFVLIAMIFFLTAGIAIYIANVNSGMSQQKDVKKIQSEYDDTGDLDTVYDEQISEMEQKLTLVVKYMDTSGNYQIYQDGTWINNKIAKIEDGNVQLQLTVNWPDGSSNSTKEIDIDGIKSESTESDGKTWTMEKSKTYTITAKVNDKTLGKTTVKIDIDNPYIEKYSPKSNGLIKKDTTDTVIIKTEVTPKDNGESGLKETEYSWFKLEDGGTLLDDTETATQNLEWTVLGESGVTNEVTEPGSYYLYVKSTDNAGNVGVEHSGEFKIWKAYKGDNEAEAEIKSSINIVHNPTAWTNTDVTATVTFDNTFNFDKKYEGNGTTYEAAMDNKKCTDEKEFETEKVTKKETTNSTIVYQTVETNGYVYAEVEDSNEKTYSQSYEITNIDKLEPDITEPKMPDNWVKGKWEIKIYAQDKDATTDYGCSGITGWQVSTDSNLTVSSDGWEQVNAEDDEGQTLEGSGTKKQIEKKYTITDNGTYYIYVKDGAGNVTKKEISTSYIDGTGPSIDVTGNPTDWTNKTVTIIITTGDDQSGIEKATINGETVDITKSEDGKSGTITYDITENGTYTIVVTDNVGNTTEKTIYVSKIDTTAPTLEITKSTESWTNQDVALTIKVDDPKDKEDIASGISKVTVEKEDGTTTTITIKDGTGTYSAEENGTYKVVVTDVTGNTTEKDITVSNIDKIKPTASISPDGGNPVIEPGNTTVTQTVTITANDEGGSKLKTLQYGVSSSSTTDPTEWKTFTSGTKIDVPLSGGNKYIIIKVTDNAGNELKISSKVFKVDYKIVYNTNGDTTDGGVTTSAPSNQIKTHDVNITLSSSTMVWYGRDFNGWSTNKSSTTAEYSKGATYSKNESATLYAVWSLKNVTVNFDPQKGTTDTTSKVVTFNSKYGTLPTPTRKGYDFGGWYTETEYKNQVTEDTVLKNEETHTLYAKWIPRNDTPYTVIHKRMKLDGTYPTENTAVDGLVEVETFEGTTEAEVSPDIKQYTGFTSPTSKKTATIVGEGTTTIIYEYSRNKYTYTLGTPAGGVSTTGSTATGNYYYGATITLKATVEDGFTWVKWQSSNTTAQSDISDKSSTFTMPATNITMTPIATKINAQTVYVAKGSSKTVEITGTNMGTLSIQSGSDENVAKASISGTKLTINGVNGGDTSVKLYESTGGATATITIKVVDMSVTDTYYLTTASHNSSGINTQQISVSGHNYGTLTYKTSSSNIAAVNTSGLITATAAGSCTITITESNTGISVTCKVIVDDTDPIWTITVKSIT